MADANMVLKKLLTMYHGKYEVSHARRDGLHAFLFVTRKITNVTEQIVTWQMKTNKVY